MAERVGASRVGPTPGPPPERWDTMTVLDLLATARRWRLNEGFVSGQADGLTRALVGCLNAGEAAPGWLRREITRFLWEALWERERATGAEVDELVGRWVED